MLGGGVPGEVVVGEVVEFGEVVLGEVELGGGVVFVEPGELVVPGRAVVLGAMVEFGEVVLGGFPIGELPEGTQTVAAELVLLVPEGEVLELLLLFVPEAEGLLDGIIVLEV